MRAQEREGILYSPHHLIPANLHLRATDHRGQGFFPAFKAGPRDDELSAIAMLNAHPAGAIPQLDRKHRRDRHHPGPRESGARGQAARAVFRNHRCRRGYGRGSVTCLGLAQPLQFEHHFLVQPFLLLLEPRKQGLGVCSEQQPFFRCEPLARASPILSRSQSGQTGCVAIAAPRRQMAVDVDRFQ